MFDANQKRKDAQELLDVGLIDQSEYDALLLELHMQTWLERGKAISMPLEMPQPGTEEQLATLEASVLEQERFVQQAKEERENANLPFVVPLPKMPINTKIMSDFRAELHQQSDWLHTFQTLEQDLKEGFS